jgi:hypothetical protein
MWPYDLYLHVVYYSNNEEQKKKKKEKKKKSEQLPKTILLRADATGGRVLWWDKYLLPPN